MLKDYECFQDTRFTNPDVVNERKVPSCVEDAFEQYYQKGYTMFNKNRLNQIAMGMGDEDDNKSINKEFES